VPAEIRIIVQLALSPRETLLSMAATTGSCGLAAFKKALNVYTTSAHSKTPAVSDHSLQNPSKRRRLDSLTERPFDLEAESPAAIGEVGGDSKQPDSILYLAYGSNLSAETFKGKRGIRPLSAVNVVVPELVMTFDLAGLPYIEPCFANTKYRNIDTPSPSEKSTLLSDQPPEYHKNRWRKGLVGVVYEVTREDYAHIIATEGGGASYQDVLVDCYELSPKEDIVPEHPTSESFKAHTLYSPVFPPGKKPPKEGGRFSRPDPDYAQASARYLKLITDGADEHALPSEYKSYLHQLRSYTMTTQSQKVGAFVFAMIWLPFISLVFGLNNQFADKHGRAPKWLVAVTGAIFKAMWASYDEFFYKIFGDGERTTYGDKDGDDDDEDAGGKVRRRSIRYGSIDEKGVDVHQAV